MGVTKRLADNLQAKSGDNGVIVDPQHLTTNDQHRARHFRHDDEHIQTLARSMATNGQHTPVGVRKVEDGKLELIFGEHRHAAACLINSDKKLNSLAKENGQLHPKTGLFMLRVIINNVDDELALVSAIEENNLKKSTSVIDDVHNHERLRQEHGWDDATIAELYNIKEPWVKRMTALLKLSEEEKQLVHTGKINVMDAIQLATLDDDERAKVVGDSKDEDGEVDRDKLSKGTRDEKNKKGKTLSRSMAQVRKDIKAINESEEADDALVAFCGIMQSYIKGKIDFEEFVESAVSEYNNVKVNGVEAPSPDDDFDDAAVDTDLDDELASIDVENEED